MLPVKEGVVHRVILKPVLRALLIAWALLMILLTRTPLAPVLLLAFFGCSLVLPEIISSDARERMWRWSAILAWLITAALPVSIWFVKQELTLADLYYAVIAWLVALAVALTSVGSKSPGARRAWKILAIIWAYVGEFLWLAAGYSQNVAGTFYAGLALGCFVLILTELWFRMPSWGVVAANTIILMLLLLPIVDFASRPRQRIDPHPEIAGKAYLYDAAKQNPHAFLYWWSKYLSQYDKLMRDIFVADPGHVLPYRTRRNRQTTFFQSQVRINSLGFRGREVAPEKGNTYRIVAMGESNTFGFTLTPEHLPWPEFLEQFIHERLPAGRPVEVINTGLPHHNLEDNLYRLRTEILPLKPDMIISYHGWNGFRWLYPSLPPIFEKHIPIFHKRPLHLLAEAEFRLKMFIFKRRLVGKPILQMPPVSKLLQTKYADLYRELIEICHTNNIRLVLGNYSMAVNGGSDSDVIEFYREIFPSVYSAIKVNVMHSMLVNELTREHPEVIFADTNPGLDGDYRRFIDLMHFAPEGDRQLAENFFAPVTNALRIALSEGPPSR